MLFGRHIVELNATNNTLVRSYVWGLDLSGTMDGAGGVGGLLWVTLHTVSGPAAGTHFAAYDGNGNVVALVSATTGDVTTRYEYGPFGEPIRITGPAVTLNPFRLSTKRTDPTTDLVLYEYRTYSPSLGRWPSRDPIGEVGHKLLVGVAHPKKHGVSRKEKKIEDGQSLYAFVRNSPPNCFDRDGRELGYEYCPCGRMRSPLDSASLGACIGAGLSEAVSIITENFQKALDESLEEMDSPKPSECVKKLLRDAYNHIKNDVWGGASDAEKHCRVACAMAMQNPNIATCIGDLNEFLDALGAEFGLSSVCEWRDYYNNNVGRCCAAHVKAGKYKDCAECCRKSKLQ